MRILRTFWMRLFHRKAAHEEFEDELESHLAMHVEDGVRAGLTPAEARRQALIRLGGAEQTRQAYRERSTLPWIEGIARDLRYGMRSLLKHPAITIIAIVSIALGMGANATIFALVSRFLLRPAPVGDPSTLLAISTMQKGDRCCNPFSFPLYEDLLADAHSFSSVAAYFSEPVPASIGVNGDPERVCGQAVTPNFFGALQLPMILGRGFAGADDKTQVIVLGETLWQRRFHGDSSIIGSTILLSGRPFTVIGIAPAAFHSVDQVLYTQFWVPLGILPSLVSNAPPRDSREFHWLSVVGRMRPGVTKSQVEAELATLAGRFETAYPATDRDNSFRIEQAGTLPDSNNLKSTAILFLSGLLFIVLLVLAIAGFNVANLLFAQALARQRESAVRLALGATRAAMRRQMLLESVLIALGGGTLGVLLSFFSTRGLSSLRLPAPVPLDLQVGIDGRVLLFAFLLSVACGVLLGIGPAWAASHPRVVSALKGEDALVRSGRRWTLRHFLVAGQMAMSVVLLTTTVLFLRSLESAARIDIGFRSDGLLLLSVDPRVNGYSPERTLAFLSELQRGAAELPGVTSSVVTDVAPLSGGNRSDGFTVSGRSGKDNPFTYADLYMASPGYFATIGTPLLTGRDFGRETRSGPKTAVINQAFADRLFHGVNPIGQHITGGRFTYEVIGVAANAKSRTLGENTRPMLYRSLAQSIADDPSMHGYTLVVQAAGNPGALSEPLRRVVYSLDPSIAVYNEETIADHVRTAYVLPRLAAILFGVFGGIGVVLATIGLYGVMNYSVTRRTREIGIRMAMGAQAVTVERMVLRQGLVLSLAAMVLGWPAAWMLVRLTSSFLYGVQPHDAVTFIVVPPFLMAIALVACWLPARRAAHVDPMQALRTE